MDKEESGAPGERSFELFEAGRSFETLAEWAEYLNSRVRGLSWYSRAGTVGSLSQEVTFQCLIGIHGGEIEMGALSRKAEGRSALGHSRDADTCRVADSSMSSA